MVAAAPASGIFISYRRTDNPDAVGRIYDRLVSEFGKSRVFKDVDSIPLGQDFRTHLNDVVGACAAVIAIIGPRWVDVRDSGGQRRLDDADDFVRIELEAALARGIPVLPVLVGHAAMPGTRELPASLSTLAFRQGVEVRPDPDFHNDATRLVAALRRILDPSGAGEPERTAPDAGEPAQAPVPPVGARSARRLPWKAALVGALLAALLLVPALWQFRREPPPPQLRTEIVTPPTIRPQDYAISPDGRSLVFVVTGANGNMLWVRPLDSQEARALPGTEGAMRPFWSPDSRSIGYFTPFTLSRVDLDSGRSRVLSPTGVNNPGGASWGTRGQMLLSWGTGPLLLMDAESGESRPITQLNASDLAHMSPVFLPDGKRFLFLMATTPARAGLYLGTTDGGEPVRIAENVERATILRPGWMLFVREGSLMAQRFDEDRRALTGAPVVLAQLPPDSDSVYGTPSVAANGLIAIRAGASAGRQLRWFTRTGESRGTLGEVDATMGNPRLSPDGARVLVDRVVRGNTDIWMLDGTRATRLTFDPQLDARPVWLRDGRSLAFYSLRGGTLDIYLKSSEGSGGEVPLITDGPGEDRIRVATDVSPDGRYLAFFTSSAQPSIRIVPLQGERKPWTWLASEFSVLWGTFSPDGRWMAYASNETGRYEIYVRPFQPPGGQVREAFSPEARWQVSAAGGHYPTWSPDGREVYFLDPEGDIMATPVTATATSFATGVPKKLFATRVHGGGVEIAQGRQYDVAPDGRFLVNEVLESGPTPPISLIQNWDPRRVAAQ